ncbi:diguanylate cyclase [Eisenbergiella sp.]
MMIDRLKQTMKPILSTEQKERFAEYYTNRTYRMEMAVAVFIAVMQACMMLVFSFREGGPFASSRRRGYFSLYTALLLVTLLFMAIFVRWVKQKKYGAIAGLRMLYVVILCLWCIGITVLDQMGGNTIGVYCYLIPTIAAIMLMSPAESTVLFCVSWLVIVLILVFTGLNAENLFSNLINGSFVTLLSIFISIRYNRSMKTEFRDREIIAMQYEKIRKANELLQQMAFTDQLTGLQNRRSLMERIFKSFEEYRRENRRVEVIMVDIDYFKQYNDAYGHLQGDDCLKKIAEILAQFAVAEGVEAVRFGGEEFLLVRMEEALERQSSEVKVSEISDNMSESDMAERLLKQIREANILRNDNGQTQVTVSLGVWRGSLSRIDKVETIISYADEALYCAKHAGRNRIYRYGQGGMVQRKAMAENEEQGQQIWPES